MLAMLTALEATDATEPGEPSRRRDYHFTDTPLFIPSETPNKGTGGVPSNDSLADG